MRYEKRHQVRASQQAVADFHSGPGGFKALNPFFIPIMVHEAPDPLVSGSEMAFTLWLGPIPVRWRARIEDSDMTGFTDVQLRGPFKAWQHRHSFIRIDDNTTEIHDAITAEMPDNLLKWPVAAMMWLGLPVLFQYRAWKTRKVLENPTNTPQQEAQSV
jgi:ligand-binding SRPBCC domain-containing protein